MTMAYLQVYRRLVNSYDMYKTYCCELVCWPAIIYMASGTGDRLGVKSHALLVANPSVVSGTSCSPGIVGYMLGAYPTLKGKRDIPFTSRF